ncbi:MAG: DNA ligase (NAD(+)) LigA, partial [Saprospiraceae bacterium]|nr:DNA ligase (NAD(+)) LigA [Saprospiraceae bacterium]
FYDLQLIKDISDIYNLDYDKVSQLEGFGQKSVDNLRAAIDKAKKNPIHKLLHSLSIHHLGKKASKLISEQIEYIIDLKSWNTDRFLEIKDIGPVIAENAILWFNDAENLTMLQRMESYGVNMWQTDEDKPLVPAEGGVFSGKTILFTGTLLHMGRKEAEEKAARAGAQNVSSVSSRLNILVVGEKAGSKLKKAQELGTVQILSEEEFMQLIGEG